jgi:hypothetical protein
MQAGKRGRRQSEEVVREMSEDAIVVIARTGPLQLIGGKVAESDSVNLQT